MANESKGGAMRRLDFIIDDSCTRKSIGAVLKSKGFSHANLTAVKFHGDALFNGESVPMKFFITEKGMLTVLLPAGKSENVVPAELPLDIAYEDCDLIILRKPAGMPTHPVREHQLDTLANAVAYHDAGFAFRPVNRLDRNTSGLVLVAKNAFSASAVRESVKKQYIAVVHGVITCGGTVDATIRTKEGSGIVREAGQGGDSAVTHYSPLCTGGDYTVLRLELETGRTHQIRVHMSYIGHPLVGDDLYGGRFELGMRRHALHCGEMTFVHPVTREKIAVAAPLPQDMEDAVRQIEKDAAG